MRTIKRICVGLLAGAFALSTYAATLNPVQLLNSAGSTSGQAIVSTGASTPPAWGSVTATALAAQAANTVVANVTGSSASPTAFAMPSCSTSSSALQWTSGSGFTCYANTATTTGTLAQFAATTSAQLAGVLSDETGSGAAVFGTSPTIGTATLNTPTISGGTINNATVGQSTPLAGSFTTLSATGLISPASTVGIKGTTTNDSPATGSVGESNSPSAATGVTTPSGTTFNVTSVSLTAGDYFVWGLVSTSPAAGTVTSGAYGGISTSSGGVTNVGGIANITQLNYSTPASQGISFQTPLTHLKLASTTTIYLIANITYSTSTLTTSGWISWFRVR